MVCGQWSGYTSRLMTKRTFVHLMFVISALFLAGCRGSGPGGGETRPTPIRPEPGAEGGGSPDRGGAVGRTIALRLWAQRNDTFDEAYQALADAYEDANPGVTVAVETFDVSEYGRLLKDALVAGTAGDVLQMPGSTLCIYSPNLAPAPDTILALNPQALFDPVLLGGFVCDGALFGLPQEPMVPWGLAVSARSATADTAADTVAVAWDFVRFATLDPIQAAEWNAATETSGAMSSGE